MQLRGICENMITINNQSLNDVSEEEYKRRCEETANDIRLSKRFSSKGITDIS